MSKNALNKFKLLCFEISSDCTFLMLLPDVLQSILSKQSENRDVALQSESCRTTESP